jgi:pimeloyl-ACP methyl ester carboxylesterase
MTVFLLPRARLKKRAKSAEHTMSGVFRTEAGGQALTARYRKILSAWPVPDEQFMLETSQGRTFVVASGPHDAPPLLLLHGAGGNSLFWMRDVAEWSKYFRVLAVDIIGEPGLSAPSRPPLGSDRYARWLNDIFDGLAIARARMIGVSLGGWLALDFATRNPDRVEKLVLLCPGGVGRQKMGFLFKAMFYFMLGEWGRRKAMAAALGPQYAHGDETRSAYLLSVFREFRPRRVKLPRFTDEMLQRLAMHVLLIVGGRDAMLDSFQTQARMAHAVPQLTVKFLADIGHLIAGQTNDIRDFLLDGESGLRGT